MVTCYTSLSSLDCQALVVFLDERVALDETVKSWDAGAGGLVAAILAAGDFRGKANECLSVLTPSHSVRKVVLVGLGQPGKTTLDSVRQAAGTGARALQDARHESAAFVLPASSHVRWSADAAPSAEQLAQATVEGARLALFRFTRAAKANAEPSVALSRLGLVVDETEQAAAQAGVERAIILAECIDQARELVVRPGNDVTPAVFAQAAETLGAAAGLTVNVYDETWLTDKGFAGVLAIARGSDQPPRLIVMHHRGGPEGQKPVAIVGKGVTFDSGGIGIKPSQGMHKMKYDMAGGASTLGIMLAAARLNLPLNLVGVIPAVENMPSERALCPNEVVTMYGGLSVEINDTDAEGRVILADALAYAAKDLDAAALIDMATLTGAVGIALGRDICGVMGTEPALVQSLLQAGEAVGEPGWELPLDGRFDEMVKSDLADLLNYPGRNASCITAASFMKPFTFGKPWVHLDIAGVAWSDKATGYRVKGPTGAPIRTVLHWLQSRARQA